MGFLSAITGVIGGIQSASAASDAAAEQVRGFTQAGETVNAATGQANERIDQAAGNASERVYAAADGAQAGMNEAAGKANAGLNPYQTAGADASGRLSELVKNPDKFVFNQDDPSYQFRLNEGLKALQRSAAARGSGMGGAAMRSITRYAQDTASTEYGKAFDRFQQTQQERFRTLSGVAGMGLTATGEAGRNLTSAASFNGQVGLRAGEYGGNATMHSGDVQARNTLDAGRYMAGTQMGVADAKAAEHIGRANAWNGALKSIGGAGDEFVAGGFSGGGGFKLGDAVRYGS